MVEGCGFGLGWGSGFWVVDIGFGFCAFGVWFLELGLGV